jgi:hypothetical protein
LQEAIFHLDFFQSRAYRGHALGVDIGQPAKDRSSQSLSAFYTLQKLAERHLKGRCQSRQVAETDLARTSFEVRYMNLMNTRLFGKVDLPPTPFLSELPDSFAKVCAHIRGHSSSIDLVEALYLVDALSREIRAKDRSVVPISRSGPACRVRRRHDASARGVSPNRKSYDFLNQVRDHRYVLWSAYGNI